MAGSAPRGWDWDYGRTAARRDDDGGYGEERDCFSWPTQNPPRHQLPGKFEAAPLFALTRSQLIATTWRERASERASKRVGLPLDPPLAQIL